MVGSAPFGGPATRLGPGFPTPAQRRQDRPRRRGGRARVLPHRLRRLHHSPDLRRVVGLLATVAAGAALSATLGALLSSVAWLQGLARLVFIFLVLYLRRFGPRYVALGMVALTATPVSIDPCVSLRA